MGSEGSSCGYHYVGQLQGERSWVERRRLATQLNLSIPGACTQSKDLVMQISGIPYQPVKLLFQVGAYPCQDLAFHSPIPPPAPALGGLKVFGARKIVHGDKLSGKEGWGRAFEIRERRFCWQHASRIVLVFYSEHPNFHSSLSECVGYRRLMCRLSHPNPAFITAHTNSILKTIRVFI